MSARGFQTLARRLGVLVVVGSLTTRGLYDRATKSEALTGKDYAPDLVGTPSVLMETVDGLGVDDPLTVDGTSWVVRDLLAEGDGALTRYFLGA
nr:hypothetical protein [uncultured Holophaga sp.]